MVLAAKKGVALPNVIDELLSLQLTITNEKGIDAVSRRLLDGTVEILDGRRGALFLKEGDYFRLVASTRFSEAEVYLEHGEEISEMLKNVLNKKEALLYNFKPLIDDPNIKELHINCAIDAPLSVYDEIEGVLYIDKPLKDGAFGDYELSILTIIAQQGSMILDSAWLTSKLEEKQEELERIEKELRTEEKEEEIEGELLPPSRFKYDYSNIVGVSTPMLELFEVLDKVIDAEHPVLIQGESGTGKELIARSIHFNGPRQDKPFVSVNCGAIAPTLIESELFGFVKVAFTGADRDKPGLFKMANQGTLFLDEIAELPFELQSKLLRVLQEKRCRPVGGEDEIPVDARIISATNKDLDQEVKEGQFREDLYYRLNIITLHVPPLRERLEDLEPLIYNLLRRVAEEEGKPLKSMSSEVMEKLKEYNWPGNVRQLENEIRKVFALSGEKIMMEDLSPEILKAQMPIYKPKKEREGNLSQTMAQIESDLIMRALREADGNKTEAAKALGINRSTLYEKLQKLRK